MPIFYNEQFSSDILPPAQGAGNAGKVLQSDGTTANWHDIDSTTLLANGTIGLQKLVPLPANSLVGNPTNDLALRVPITLGSNLSFNGGVLNATGGGQTLPNFTDLNGLRGDGSNVPVSDTRLQYLANGDINIGIATNATILNGRVSKPSLGIFYADRITSNQATFAATTSTTIQWNNSTSNSLGETIANISANSVNILQPGTYIINGLVSLQSTSATRGRLFLQPNSATFAAGTSSYFTSFRLPTANTFETISFNYIVRVSVAGTFNVSVTLAVGTGTILASSAVLASSSTTEIHITKIG